MEYAIRTREGVDVVYFKSLTDAERYLAQSLISQKFKLGKVTIEPLKRTTCPACGGRLNDSDRVERDQ